jgi:hypothetical protein
MARYIDADKVMEEIARIGGHNLCEWETIGVKALIDRQPTADVAPKSEVDALEKEVERLKKILNNYALQYGTCMSQQKVIDKAKSEVAREIFEEIEDLLHKHFVEWDFCYFDEYLGEDFDELKKKYTEEKE